MAVREDLELRIQDALRQIDQLERNLAESLAAAAREGGASVSRELQRGESVRIRLPPPDTSAIPPAINRAIDSADTTVDPTVAPGAASDVTGAVNAAVQAADTSVAPTVAPGGAASVTGAIDAAVGAADTAVVVTATITGAEAIASACREAECVDQGLKDSTESAKGLGGALSGIVALLAAAGATEFFREAVLAAADVGETISKNNVVFAESAATVEAWAADSARAMGLARDEAIAYAGNLGVLLQSTGNTAEASAEMATTLIGLSGDLASFSNVQGGAQQVSEALSAALRGEAEQARALGIILTEEGIKRAAVTHGIAAQGEELDAQQKQLAIYQEILRQTTLAQGDFARTADSLPNTLRTLSAEYRNVQAAVGQDLLPSVIEFTQLIRSDGLPALQELATAVVPALIALLQALAPAFGLTVDVLVAFAPLIEAVAFGLQNIPGPLLAIAGVALLVVRNLALLKAAFVALQANPAILAITAATAAVVALVGALGQADAAAARQARANEALRQSLLSTEAAYTDLTGAVADYIVTGQDSEFASEGAQRRLNELGISAEEVAGLLRRGRAGFEEFVRRLDFTTDATERWNVTNERAQDAMLGLITNSTDLSNILPHLDDATVDLVESFEDQQRTLEGASRAEAEAAVLAGRFSATQLEAARAATAAADGSDRWADALEFLNSQEQAVALSTARNNALFSEAAFSGEAAAQATEDQLAAIRELRGELDPANAALQLTAEQQARLNQELQGGSFTAQEFSALATELGISVEDLAAAEEASTQRIADSLQAQRDAVQGWYDQLIQQMPAAGQAFRDFNDQATIQEAVDQFIMDSLAFAEAQGTLNAILEGGFDDLATFLSTQPPAIIREFAGLTNAELATFEGQIEAANDILATGAETAETNAGLLAGNVGSGFEGAVENIETADLPGAVSAEVEGAGQAAVDAAGSEQGGGAIRDAFVVGTNIGLAMANGMTIQRVGVLLAGIRLGQTAIEGIRIGAGVRSPSIYAYQAGSSVAEGFELGYLDRLDPAVFAAGAREAVGALAGGPAFGAQALGASTSAGAGAGGDLVVYVQAELDGEPVTRRVRATVQAGRNQQARTIRAGRR